MLGRDKIGRELIITRDDEGFSVLAMNTDGTRQIRVSNLETRLEALEVAFRYDDPAKRGGTLNEEIRREKSIAAKREKSETAQRSLENKQRLKDLGLHSTRGNLTEDRERTREAFRVHGELKKFREWGITIQKRR